MTEHAPDLSETDARQGRRGRHVFVILVVSLALVVIAFVALYASHAGGLVGRAGQTAVSPSAARAFNGPEPAAKVDDQGQVGHSPGPSAAEPSASTPS